MKVFKIFPSKHFFSIICILVAFAWGCGSYIQETIVVLDNKVHERNKDLLYMPTDTIDLTYNGLKRKQSVFTFYKQRNLRAAWVEDKQLSEMGHTLISIIKDIRYFGLLPTDYHIGEIMAETQKYSPDLMRLDALLTDAFLKISKDLKYGRLSNLKSSNDDSNRIALLHQLIINNGDIKKSLEGQEPALQGYQNLKYALKVTLEELKDPEKYSIMMGYLGKEEAINKKIQLIEINLERWRWENKGFGDRYIFINIPSFLLQVFSHDSVILESKVIVGKPQKPTPSISTTINCFVLYPNWHLPKKLAVNRYLPLIQKDSAFISINNFDVLDKKGNLLDPQKIDWKKYNKKNFPYELRKRLHPESSLGVIDLYYMEFPLYIFMNDSTDADLFDKEIRAFTDGSIKLEKAIELAHILYNNIDGERAPLEKYLKLKNWKPLDILNPYPVHVRYFTCEYKGNKFYQYNDVYSKDQKLIKTYYNDVKQNIIDIENIIH